jgi:hypothetical protein
MLASIRQKLKGFKTLILARVYVAAGGIVALHDIAVPYVAGVDWTPRYIALPGMGGAGSDRRDRHHL